MILNKKEDEEKLKEEAHTQHNINELIDKKESFVFKAGAGSGKTYALVQSIKHLIKQKGPTLQLHNQQIVVITFTNVAANEIKERLGNSQLVLVSTIHERLWNLIGVYRKELLEVHLDKLKDEIKILEEKISNEKRFHDLNEYYQTSFVDAMENNKELFYQYYSEPAAIARDEYKQIKLEFDWEDSKLLSNINNFRKLVNNLFRKRKYEITIKNIEEKKPDYTEVIYNPQITRDRLEYMYISHDTLLSYSKSMIERHKLLQQITINQYPYFLIDEYQDTDPLVVDIIQILDTYSDKSSHHFFVGYYGDEMQSIYSNGVGDKLTNKHISLRQINKKLNRRSYSEVINVINKLRSDQLEQKSIYKNATGGSVKFYYGDRNHVKEFIESYKSKWDVDEKNPINCLFLTNRGVASQIGISKLYSVMQNANRYTQSFGFELLNTELLSKQYDRLGEIQKTLYNLFSIISLIANKDKTVNNILITKELEQNLTLKNLNLLIKDLERINGDSLNEIIESIEIVYRTTKELKFKKLIDKLLCQDRKEVFSKKNYELFLLNTLGKLDTSKEISNEEADKKVKNAKRTLEELLLIDKEEFLTWFKYLTDSEEQVVKYHTYHGTKGLEFKNVIIIMENNFGRSSYFNRFFEKRSKSTNDLGDNDLKIIKEANNLLYVAASRAIKNLRIYYVDDIKEFKHEITTIFNEVIPYELKE